MTDLELSEPSELRDTAAIRRFEVMTSKLGLAPDEAFARVAATTRDRCRSPFQWSGEPNAGFCPPDIRPWLPVNPDHARGVNVAGQRDDPGSILSFYRRLIDVRRRSPALTIGDYHALDVGGENVVAYLRADPESDRTCIVLLNFSEESERAPRRQRSRQLACFERAPRARDRRPRRPRARTVRGPHRGGGPPRQLTSRHRTAAGPPPIIICRSAHPSGMALSTTGGSDEGRRDHH